jgi:hypothetical protein
MNGLDTKGYDDTKGIAAARSRDAGNTCAAFSAC